MHKFQINKLKLEYVKWKLIINREISALASAMKSAKIVPDVIPKAPEQLLKVCFEGGLKFKPGDELTPTQVRHFPCLFWTTKKSAFYTICMVNPDAPAAVAPKLRKFTHWLVGNVPEDDVVRGDDVMQYLGAGPQDGTGYHRYVILVYKQAKRLSFDEPRVDSRTTKGRALFSIKNFSAKYQLGDPIAGTFFKAKYDEYVTIMHKKLGLV